MAGGLLAVLVIVGVVGPRCTCVDGAPQPAKVDPIVLLQDSVGALSKRLAVQESHSKTVNGQLNLIQTDLKDIRRYVSQIQHVQPPTHNQGPAQTTPAVAHASILSACIDDKVYRKGKAEVYINEIVYTSASDNVNMVTFNQTTGQVAAHVGFDTARGEGGEMRMYLDKIPAHSVVLIAIRDVAVSRLPMATDHRLIEDLSLRLTNSTKAAEEDWIEKDTSWAIESTGHPHVTARMTYDAGKVLDGRVNTLWNPGGMGRYHNNWYIIFDFKQFYQISTVRIRNYGDWTHDVTRFVFQASYKTDPSYDWMDVVRGELEDTRNNLQQEFGGFSATARFWRLLIKETGNGYQPWLCEVDFFGFQSPMMASFAAIVKKGSKTSWAVVDSNMIVAGATIIETAIPLHG
ncbi:hypothetical protein Bbelb_175170 [Branchiostoma belcheri]|nr:hypothetical protein Bbelb_175170 [Branchiostoma belcheri]